MSEGSPVHEITPAETYQIDSDEFDSEEERYGLDDDEYECLLDEAENGYTDEEMQRFTADLKERGLINFLRTYLNPKEGRSRSLRKLLLGFGRIPPAALRSPTTPNFHLLPFAKKALSRILRSRERLAHLNTISQAVDLLRNAKKVLVLSGAGISTSCGIPDFRSSTGLYAQLQAEGKYELDDPQQMFDIRYFKEHPEVFYSFAKQIYPSNFTPSPCHRWIKLLEDRGVLLRNYTQNIDTLESLAGVSSVLQCHGSFKTASCLVSENPWALSSINQRCKTCVPGQTIEPYIMSSQIPYCGTCRKERVAQLDRRNVLPEARRKTKGKGKAKGWGPGSDESDDQVDDEWGGGLPGIMKASPSALTPDITFFGQSLDSKFDECLFRDREEVDLLVVIGTSLKVAPVSEVLTHIPHSVPQIFINLTPVTHVQPDICLLGDADTIVAYLSHELGWEIPPPAAVVRSPDSERKFQAAGAATKSPSVSRERISRLPPEKVVWVSGVGELRHMHLLSSRMEQDAQSEAESIIDAEAENVQDNNGAANGDRPSKRTKLCMS